MNSMKVLCRAVLRREGREYRDGARALGGVPGAEQIQGVKKTGNVEKGLNANRRRLASLKIQLGHK